MLVWPAGVLQDFGVWLVVGAGLKPAPTGRWADLRSANRGFSSPRLRGLDVGPSFHPSVCPRCQAVGPEFGRLSCAVLHRSVSPELVL